MARILLVDPSETARRALRGILARGEHKLVATDTAADAWTFIQHNAQVDLVFCELELGGGNNGLTLVQRLKADPLLKFLPVVIYAAQGDRDAVKRALELRVQNFLIKPYHDDDIFAELDKAEANPWRDRFFEEEKSFCKMMGYTPEQVRRMLGDLRDRIVASRPEILKWTSLQDHRPLANLLLPLREEAEAAGSWGTVDCINRLLEHSAASSWTQLPIDVECLDLSVELIALRIEPDRISPGFLTPDETAATIEAREREQWLAAPAAGRCPMTTWDRLRQEIEQLRGCPVIDSAAAAFQMSANGHPSCINPLMDLVARDPGLSVQMLIAAHQAHPPEDEFNRIEDARLAVGQLGELRLQDQARRLILAEERVLNLPPIFSWPRLWAYQRGVARIAQLICKELEFYSLEPIARTAGQLHDIGKLLLAHLRPAGFQAIIQHAHRHHLPLAETEKLFLECTTSQMAAHFAEKAGLSHRLIHVLRWIDNPRAATENANLVAIISLARALCRHNQVGTSGEPPLDHPPPLEETPEWQILSEGLYPSFNLRKFEVKVHAYCGRLRTELSGHQTGTVGELIAQSVNS